MQTELTDGYSLYVHGHIKGVLHIRVAAVTMKIELSDEGELSLSYSKDERLYKASLGDSPLLFLAELLPSFGGLPVGRYVNEEHYFTNIESVDKALDAILADRLAGIEDADAARAKLMEEIMGEVRGEAAYRREKAATRG